MEMKQTENPQVGDRLRDSWRLSFGEKGRLTHVRALVDDHVVLRWWSPRRGWMYKVEWLFDGVLLGYSPDRRRR